MSGLQSGVAHTWSGFNAASGLPSTTKEVLESHGSRLGLPCWGLQVPLPPGKDSVVMEEKQKTKPGPFSFSAGPWERHRAPAEWSDLEKVKQASEVVQRHRGRGAAPARKETLYMKAPFSLSSGADTRH